MIDIILNPDNIKKKRILIIMAGTIALLMLQCGILSYLKGVNTEVIRLESDVNTTKELLNKKTDTLVYMKRNFNIDIKTMPELFTSQSDCYSFLINLLSLNAMQKASVVKENEDGDTVTFSVSGESNYFDLLRLFTSFRESRYLIRITTVELNDIKQEKLTFHFSVIGKVDTTIKNGIDSNE